MRIEFVDLDHYPQVMTLSPRLRLRHLRVFLEVARERSLTSAAHVLGVSQPALSKTVRELEDIVGATLFDRSPRGLELSGAGLRFHAHAARVEQDLVRAGDAARAASVTSQMRVGALPTAATDLVPRASLDFAVRHPACGLVIATGPNDRLLADLRSGVLDLVVGRLGPPTRMEGVAFESLYTDEIVAVARPGHDLAGGDPTDPMALSDWPLVLPPPGALIEPPVRAWLAGMGIAFPDAALRTVSLAVGRGVVLASDAVWFISAGVVAADLREGRLVVLALRSPIFAGPIGVSTRGDVPPGPDAAAFHDCLRAAARTMREDA